MKFGHKKKKKTNTKKKKKQAKQKLDCKFCVKFLKDELESVKFGHKKKRIKKEKKNLVAEC